MRLELDVLGQLKELERKVLHQSQQPSQPEHLRQEKKQLDQLEFRQLEPREVFEGGPHNPRSTSRKLDSLSTTPASCLQGFLSASSSCWAAAPALHTGFGCIVSLVIELTAKVSIDIKVRQPGSTAAVRT